MTSVRCHLNPSPTDISKVYPPKGPLQLYRLEKALTFDCSRCRTSKTSKLVATNNGDCQSMLCNSCYGELVSEMPPTGTIKAVAVSSEQQALQVPSAEVSFEGKRASGVTSQLLTF